MKKNKDILKKYYTSSSFRGNHPKKRFLNFFRRNNAFGLLNEDIECLELSQNVLSDFEHDETIDNDMILTTARQALMNACVFSLYWKHKPNDNDFVHLFFMLNKARDEMEFYGSSNALEYLWNKEKQEKHTGWEEYKIFMRLGSNQAAILVIDNILHNFETPAKCKRLFIRFLNEQAKNEM